MLSRDFHLNGQASKEEATLRKYIIKHNMKLIGKISGTHNYIMDISLLKNEGNTTIEIYKK